MEAKTQFDHWRLIMRFRRIMKIAVKERTEMSWCLQCNSYARYCKQTKQPRSQGFSPPRVGARPRALGSESPGSEVANKGFVCLQRFHCCHA